MDVEQVPYERTPVRPKTDREVLEEIRASQLRTEKLVTDFIAHMEKNPMMGMLSKMMPGGKK